MTAAFPLRTHADWRAAAEAALKGGKLDKLTSKTADELPLGPLHARREGPRALRRATGPWKALTRVDLPGTADFAAQAQEDLAEGADGLEVVFAGATGAYGFGLAGSDPERLRKAFEGVAFDQGAQFWLDVAESAQAMAFAAVVEATGAVADRVDVVFGLDPIGRCARAGSAQQDESLRQAAKALQQRGFVGPFAVADGRIIHDAGGTPAQELAFVLSSGLSYLRQLEQPEVIGFRLAADADQFATLAKFRALRLLWARIEESCGLAPLPVRLHGSSAWRMLTAVEPFVNVMRTALAGFAAGLGGADSVTLTPFTQALGLPDGFARRLARNSQLVEMREARLGFVADPAAGAGAFEDMTSGLCEKAWTLFQSYEAAGGVESALAGGLIQDRVRTAAQTLRHDASRARTMLTGVSAHPFLGADGVSVRPETAAAETGHGALAPFRLSEPFERLRTRAGDARIFLAAMGPLAAHGRRVNFAREFFEAGGIVALAGAGGAAAEEIPEEFRASGAPLACLCGTDEAYAAQAESFAAALKQAGARAVWLAGRPGEMDAVLRAAGVDGFAYLGADIVATLEEALAKLGR